MERFRLPVLTLLLAIFLAGAPAALARHWEQPAQTAENMSLLTYDARLDNEMLTNDDEVAAIAPDGFVGGTEIVRNLADEGLGLSVWGDDAGQAGRQGFTANEVVAIKVWDHNADEEWDAEAFDIVDVFGGNAVEAPIHYTANAFYTFSIRAFRAEPEPEIQFSAAENDFGHVRVGRSEEWALTISNVGRADLAVSNMEIDGAGFTVNFDAEFTLPADESRDFIVAFTPDAVGNYDRNLTITSNSPGAESGVIRLLGIGDEPNPPDISLSVQDRRFGRVMVGESRSLSFFIINSGDLTLDVSDIQTGNNAYTTNFSDGNANQVPGGERREVIVTFTPQDVGEVNTTLTINSNDPDNGSVDLPLYGEGIEAGQAAVVGVLEAEHFYGKVVAGRTANWRLVVLNNGGSDLNVTGVSSDNNNFVATFDLNSYRLRPGDYLYIPTAFAPNAAGFFDGVFTISSDDQATPELQVPVSGVGDADNGRHYRYFNTALSHNLLATAVEIDGGALGAGNEVALFAPGGYCAGAGVIGGDGRVGLTAWGDDEATDMVDGFVAGDGFEYRVWIAAAGLEAAAVPEYAEGPEVFEVDGVSVLSLSVIAGAAAATPDIDLSDNYFSFGQVELDSPEQWNLRITNNGAGDLLVREINSDLNEFTTSFDGEFTLRSAESRNVVVTAAPEAEAEYYGRLTVMSNDPLDSVLYVDLFAVGVSVLREPTITLGAANHFFGMLEVGEVGTYSLRVDNTGGGLLQVTDIAVEGGNGAFATDWDNQQINVSPGEGFDLGLTFRPGQAATFQGAIVITSDDPNAGVVRCVVEGDGTAEGGYFHARQTGIVHSILVEQAIIHTPGGDGPFGPGDEIALFTQAGLCAGHGIVEEAGAAFSVDVSGDNPRTEVVDGFANGEGFIYMGYDFSTRAEIASADITVEYLEGPQTYTAGSMTRVNIDARSEAVEAQVAVSPNPYSFGAVRLGSEGSHTFQIQNTGGVRLTITGVSVELGRHFGTNYDGQRHVIEPGEAYDLVVVYHPQDAQTHEGSITVASDDPDEPNFSFDVGGAGSDEQGHFDFVDTDANMSVLVQSFLIGGVDALPGDEIGLFTPDGICAGSSAVQAGHVGEGVGPAAWGDDNGTPIVVEGFTAGQAISIHVWDDSQGHEYSGEDVTVEVQDGADLAYAANGFVVVNVNVAGAVGMSIEMNPADGDVDENSQITGAFGLVNAQGDWQFSCPNLQHFADLGNASFSDNGDNTGSFAWTPNYNAAGNHTLEVQATNGEMTERQTVLIVVTNVNRAPEVVNPLQGNLLVVDEDSWAGARADSIIILDCYNLFQDPDQEDIDTRLRFTAQFVNNAPQGASIRAAMRRGNAGNIWLYVNAMPAHWNGEFTCSVTANDQQQRDGEEGRDIRSLEATPTRDASTTYELTVRVTSINDVPRIDQPRDADTFAFAFTEDQEGVVRFHANDADHAQNELRWSMVERGNLPDEAQFVDAQDGTATLTWTPTQDQVGQNYTPLFRVTDPEGGTDEIRAQNITVGGVNDAPTRNNTAWPDLAYDEDQIAQRTDILDLDDYFDDLDNADDQLRFDADQTAAAIRTGFGIQINAQTHVLSFLFQANYNTAGNAINLVIRCVDAGGANVSSNLPATIRAINDPPTPRNADIVFPPRTETNAAIVGDIAGSGLDAKFIDVDGEALAYTIENAPQELGLSVNQAAPRTIHFNTTPDYNTFWDGVDTVVTITVRATDPAGESATRQFGMKIRPDVNDPISAGQAGTGFEYLSPANGFDIAYQDSASPIVFEWRPAIQNEWEIDTVLYQISARVQGQQDSVWMRLPETRLVVPMDTLLRRLPLHRPDRIPISWRVFAVDRAAAPLASLSGTWTFTLPALEVIQLPEGAPNSFYLTNSYPNPFNAKTSMKFGMPNPGDVNVSVWDMHGRKVADLAAGYHQAGTYELTWTADGMTSGVYIVKMQAGSFIAMQKAILVR